MAFDCNESGQDLNGSTIPTAQANRFIWQGGMSSIPGRFDGYALGACWRTSAHNEEQRRAMVAEATNRQTVLMECISLS